MSANRWGERFQCTTFGESHGAALGVVIDGCPAGMDWNSELLNTELARRKPGGSLVSSRAEEDRVEILSGVFAGKTIGTPIAMIVRNHDARSNDYENLPARAGHADDVWSEKFGLRDPRGGGRASGRETVARVMAGSVARMVLQTILPQFQIYAFARQIGPFELKTEDLSSNANLRRADDFPARFPSAEQSKDIESLLENAKKEGLSYGGTAEICVHGLPSGLGQPVFHKLKADWASALMGVGATAAVEIGDGLDSAHAEGSDFHSQNDVYGGIRGGISTGEPLRARVSFKPTSSISDVAKKGRHDPCIVPRAIPVLEAMTALVLVDHLLWRRTDRIK